MEPLTMGLIFGGLSAGQSLMSGLFGSSAAQAQAIQAQLQARNANFQRQWQIEANNRNIQKSNIAKTIANRQIETGAIKQRALQEIYAKLGYDNAKGQYSKQTNQINAALLSSVSGRNISAFSGTARALLRQNLENSSNNMANLRINYANQQRDIVTAYQNSLAQRDFNYTEMQTFIPGDTSTIQQPSMLGTLGMAGLAGIQGGLTGALLYGKNTSTPDTTFTGYNYPDTFVGSATGS